MKRLLVLILAAACMVVVAVACSQAEAANNNVPRNPYRTMEVTIDELGQNNHITRTMELNKGDTLILTLGANPTTGFNWNEQATISNAKVIEQTNYQFKSADNSSGALGVPGKAEWSFNTLAAGKSVISLNYGRPWEGGEQGEWTFELNVTVK